MKTEPDLVDIFEMSKRAFNSGFGVDCGHMVIPTIFEEDVQRERVLARADMLERQRERKKKQKLLDLSQSGE